MLHQQVYEQLQNICEQMEIFFPGIDFSVETVRHYRHDSYVLQIHPTFIDRSALVMLTVS